MVLCQGPKFVSLLVHQWSAKPALQSCLRTACHLQHVTEVLHDLLRCLNEWMLVRKYISSSCIMLFFNNAFIAYLLLFCWRGFVYTIVEWWTALSAEPPICSWRNCTARLLYDDAEPSPCFGCFNIRYVHTIILGVQSFCLNVLIEQLIMVLMTMTAWH